MKKSIFLFISSVLGLFFYACQQETSAWQQFVNCAGNDCVAETMAVKDALLASPEPVLRGMQETYEKGEDHVIGWLYILQDSVLLNAQYGTLEARGAILMDIITTAKGMVDNAELSEMAMTIINTLGAVDLSALPSESTKQDGLSIDGTYEYGGSEGKGYLKVSVLDAAYIQFSLGLVGGPPAHNRGNLEAKAKHTGGNVYQYETSEYGQPCRLEFTFSKGSATIKTLAGDSAACGFGNGVMADNTYQLINN